MSKIKKLPYSKALKFITPTLSKLLFFFKGHRLLRYVEAYLAILQGKGAGTGWDMQNEVRAERLFIHSTEPLLFDVGANKGEWSQNMNNFYAGKCKLYLFEPSEHCCKIIQNYDLNNFIIISKAVGEKTGKASFWVPFAGAGISSLSNRRDTFFSDLDFKEEIVEVVTLDEIISYYKIDVIDFLKMDIEGHELFALKGARKAISSGKIKSLSFEFGSGNINSRTYFRDIWDFLTEYGYTIYRILPGGNVIEITAYYEDLEYFRGVSNYIASK